MENMKDKKMQKSEISITKLELLERLEALQSSGKSIVRTKNKNDSATKNFRVDLKNNRALSGYWKGTPQQVKENQDYAAHFEKSTNKFWLGKYAGYVLDSPKYPNKGSVIIASPTCYKITDMKDKGSADDGLLTNFLNKSGAQHYYYLLGGSKKTELTHQVKQVPNVPSPSSSPQFANVEQRPEQGEFRKRVKDAYQGKCAISGCNVDKALDAAHKKGRDWHKHNQAEDGYLLRKDLHALYDEGLLTISDKGKVEINIEMAKYYKDFVGIKISTPIYSKD
jgi:hypothetical protein